MISFYQNILLLSQAIRHKLRRGRSHRLSRKNIIQRSDNHRDELPHQRARNQADEQRLAPLVDAAAAVFREDPLQEEAKPEGERHQHALMAAVEDENDGMERPPCPFETAERHEQRQASGNQERHDAVPIRRHVLPVGPAVLRHGELLKSLRAKLVDDFHAVQEWIDG